MTYDQAVSLLALLGLEIYAHDARQIELREALETIWRQQERRPPREAELRALSTRPKTSKTKSHPITLPRTDALRYANGVIDRRRDRIICVQEDHTLPGKVIKHSS